MKKDSTTIKEAISNITSNKMLLPAMQRKVVWNEQQVINLYDSIMKGYPFGMLIFWELTEKENIKKYRFYQFVKDYSEKERTINPIAAQSTEKKLEIVLDGQQRLTSLYMGLCGSRIKKIRPKVSSKKPENWVVTHLYFKPSIEEVNRDEDDKQFEFKFLEDKEAERINERVDDKNKYYLVSEFYNMTKDELKEKFKFGNIRKDEENWKYQLELLRYNINDNDILKYHTIKDPKIQNVLEIFKRINSGGTVLSPATLMFSTIVTNWDKGREKIETLLKTVNSNDIIKLREDTIVRICLYLLNQSTSSKLETINDNQIVSKIEDKWGDISDAIIKAKNLLGNNHIYDSYIKSYNALFPIIYYYFYVGNMDKTTEQEFIKYFLISQLFGLFGGNSGVTLEKVREALCNNKILGDVKKNFRLSDLKDIDLSAGRIQAFRIKKEQIERIIDNTKYGSSEIMLIMCLMYPNIEININDFDADHVCSQDETKKFTSRKSKEEKKEIEWYINGVPNLQLLSIYKNRGDKKKDSLYTWVVEKNNQVEYDPFRDKNNEDLYRIDNINIFKEFYCGRRELIINYLCDRLDIGK